jgi:glutamate/tyrosine decarboxylase-like PLP-dependent enzyme
LNWLPLSVTIPRPRSRLPPRDLGPESSRGFRALKIWFALVEHGGQGFGKAIAHSCRPAGQLRIMVQAEVVRLAGEARRGQATSLGTCAG